MSLEKIYQILPSNFLNFTIIMMLTLISTAAFMSFLFEKTNNSCSTKKNLELVKTPILSLFLSFDPTTTNWMTLSSQMNWIVMIFILMIFNLKLWVKPTRLNQIQKAFFFNVAKQFEISLKNKKDGAKMLFLAIFSFILFINLMGLIPNLFTCSSHITLNLFISIPLWVSFMLFGWTKFTQKMFAHLVPSGTPIPLISFMVLIETISTTIRPFTLSIRLMANMISGHLLLTLLGNAMQMTNIFNLFIMLIIQTMLFSLELSVGIIQAYVFCMLLTLYADECDY